MQVFKLYFRILKRELPVILLYGIVFSSISIFMAFNAEKPQSGLFREEKTEIAWINNDDENELTGELKNFIRKKCSLLLEEEKLSENALWDALFYRKIKAIVTVPEGFTKDFTAGRPVKLSLKEMDAAEVIPLKIWINQFLATAEWYRDFGEALTMTEILEKTELDMARKSEVLIYSDKDNGLIEQMVSYADFSAYGLIVLLILGTGTVMTVFQNADMKRRNGISPLSMGKFKLQLILSNLVYTLLIFLTIAILMFLICPGAAVNGITILMLVNMLLFSFCALSVGFLVGILVKGMRFRNVITNAAALFLCILGGIFAPREILQDTVQSLESFFPTYWFVKANHLIGGLTDLTGSKMEELIKAMMIQFGFALVLFGIALVIGKKRSTEAF